MEISLISWNIWKGKYLDKVVEFLKNDDTDIICLQEVTESMSDGKRFNIAEYISRQLNTNYIYYKSFTTDRHTPVFDLGDAILSRFPIVSSTCYALSSLDEYEGSNITEPRSSIEAVVEINGKNLTILNTHLGYSEGFAATQIRDKQTRKLIERFKKNNFVLAGDFNSLPDSEVVQQISKYLQNTDQNLTEPTFTNFKDPDQTKSRIDYIFTSSDITASNFEILKTDASDHYPLKVVLRTSK